MANLPNSPVIALVGHMCKDEIISSEGILKTAIGGTAYNLAALASVMKTGAILPICRLGCDLDDLSESLFSISPFIEKAGVFRTRFPNVIHRLTYFQNGERSEWNSGKQTPLPLGPLCLHADAILLNFISGSDVSLGELKRFKKVYNGLIYSDFHSLSLGYSRDQIRYLRRHPRWKDYLSAIDMLQMNIGELCTLFDDNLDSPDSVKQACRVLHMLGPANINITLGAKGVIVSDIKNGIMEHLNAVKLPREVDPTGCGDTFAGVFLYNYLLTGDTLKSAETANLYAAAKATFSGLDGFRDIHSLVEHLKAKTFAN